VSAVHVLVIGGGIGGLCLAHGLRGAGIGVAVYERDESSDARAQGYRISLKREGVDALRRCLPGELFELCAATAIRTATRMTFMDSQLRPKFSKPLPPQDDAHGFGVNRRTLREILLTDLTVHFGKSLERYEERADGEVTAYFTDGGQATGDVLVGADGTSSAVRRQLVPGAVIDELDAAIYGRTPLTDDVAGWLPDKLTDTFNRVIAEDAALAVATCRARERPSAAVARLAPRARLTDVDDYLQWMVSPLADAVRDADPASLHRAALDRVTGWHPGAARVIAEAEVAATFAVVLTSARPVDGWDSRAVTLLGDAIHTMSPGRGEGANTALHDADLLRGALSDAHTGRLPLELAKRRYEAQMLYHGFQAVEQSLSHPFGPPRAPGIRAAAPQG
jgi:2-polyprenyl-6-methoxyphenol hydroxylase-like FAD-dependent oxidoreductase